MSYQRITLIGNLGGSPELKYMPDGTGVCSFSLATNRTWGSGESKKTETCWFRVSVWGGRSEVANRYLSKGSRVLVEGRLQPDKSTGGPRIWVKQDGTAAASFEVRALDFQFMSAKGETSDGYQQSNGSNTAVEEEDDIPF